MMMSMMQIQARDLTDPTDPTVKGDTSTNSGAESNIVYLKQNGQQYKGIVKNLKGFYLKGLVWEGNDNASQEILIDFVDRINIRGYTQVKKQKDNLSIIFYIPYQFDIKLKNGTEFHNAKGRIKELESFEVYNEIGKGKCYTYFIRYWLEDQGKFQDNQSKDYNEKAKVPNDVVISLEFK
jgi:hypothetical protein